MLKIGHRGAAGHAPENTLLSVRRAIEFNVDFVEIDIQSTRDDQLVLMHDKRVDRTTDGSGYVRDLFYSDLRRLDAGFGERVPRLREALAECLGKVGVVLEIISPESTSEVVEEVRRFGDARTTIFASFHHRVLVEVRNLIQPASTLALLEGVPVNRSAFARDSMATHVGLGIDSFDVEFATGLQREGFSVLAYTVNDRRDLEWLAASGVDGVLTDTPEIFFDQ